MAERIQAGREGWDADGAGERASTTVVFFHGFSANPTGVNPIARPVNDAGYGVRVVRFPGHGSTVKDFRRSRFADWRGAAVDAVDTAVASSDKTVVVGHSVGGAVALDLGGSRDDIDGVVAINPWVVQREDLLAKAAPLLQYVVPLIPRDLAGAPTSDIAKPDVVEDAYGVIAAKPVMSLVREFPRIRSQLVNLTVPLMLISSPQDHTVAPRNSDVVEELVGTNELTRVVCERSYHVPQVDWDAELVIDSILGFVERIHAA